MEQRIRSARQYSYTIIIAFAFASFGFFGTLGLFFLLLLFVAVIVLDFRALFTKIPSHDVLLLYFGLTTVFFWQLARGMYDTPWTEVSFAISPVFPIAIVGLLLIFTSQVSFYLKRTTVSICASTGILMVYVTYIALQLFPDGHTFTEIAPKDQRLSLLTGNPIPFSTIVGGLSLMTLLGWHSRNKIGKVTMITIAFLGAYAATVWSGSRGATIGCVLVSPIILYNLSRSFKLTIGYFLTLIIMLTTMCILVQVGTLDSGVIDRILKGAITLFTDTNLDSSNFMRINMWVASWTAILEKPLFGHGISERYLAITPYLPEIMKEMKFTHAHNDILSSGVAGGILGLFCAVISLTCGAIYVLLKRCDIEIICYAFALTGFCLVIATSNTIFFNDSSSSFYAFAIVIIIMMENFKSASNESNAR